MQPKHALLVAVPLLLFILLLLLMVFGLQQDPRTIPSVLIGKPLPAITLPELRSGKAVTLNQRMEGQAWMLNVWASWCLACREEHPVLVAIGQQHPELALIGLNYKDQREDALAWLKKFHDPYRFSLADIEGRAGIELGVYGVPETYVIDAKGKIAYKHIGPLSIRDFRHYILPLLGLTP